VTFRFRPRALLLIGMLLYLGLGLAPARPAWQEIPPCPPGHPVVIDPGHGGLDGGATSDGVVEKEIVLDIGLRLRTELQRRRIPVVMTREKDVGFGPLRKDLAFRSWLANQCRSSLFLSLHINAMANPNQSGMLVFYGSSRPSRDAGALFDQLLRQSGLHSRREPPRQQNSFVVIRHTTGPALLLELGFLTNPNDRAKLETETYRHQVAQVLAEAAEKVYHLWVE
jgi:N-acetylmuramoyl-L-alanine amidase